MNDLDFFRMQIDETDKKLLEFLAKRQKIVGEVGKYKKEKGIKPLQKDRWKEVLESRKNYAKELGLNEKIIENIWNEIHKYSLEIEK